MNRQRTIEKLTENLATAINQQHNKDIIRDYIRMAIVTELDRQNQKLDIIQKLDPNNGAILGEYWGMSEICETMPEKDAKTVKRRISDVLTGARAHAYGFSWRKV